LSFEQIKLKTVVTLMTTFTEKKSGRKKLIRQEGFNWNKYMKTVIAKTTYSRDQSRI